MGRFYVLKVGTFAQYKFAWFEPFGRTRYAKTFPKCPKCNGPIGPCFWLPPHQVVLKQPKQIGDFVCGAGGPDLLVSQRFRDGYLRSRLRGVKSIFPVVVSKLGSKSSSTKTRMPKLFGVYFERPATRVLHSRMGVRWDDRPKRGYCALCGPGGGGRGGTLRSWRRVVLDERTWAGHDFFIPINFAGTLIVSDRARLFLERVGFTNFRAIPCADASYSFYGESPT